MIRRPLICTLSDTLVPYTTLFLSAIRSLVEDGEASADRLASARWTLALSAAGLPPETAARDSGVRAFVRLRPGEDAPDRLAPHDEAALAQRLGTGPVFR